MKAFFLIPEDIRKDVFKPVEGPLYVASAERSGCEITPSQAILMPLFLELLNELALECTCEQAKRVCFGCRANALMKQLYRTKE